MGAAKGGCRRRGGGGGQRSKKRRVEANEGLLREEKSEKKQAEQEKECEGCGARVGMKANVGVWRGSGFGNWIASGEPQADAACGLAENRQQGRDSECHDDRSGDTCKIRWVHGIEYVFHKYFSVPPYPHAQDDQGSPAEGNDRCRSR